jgi:hypothetical protein
VILQIQAFDLCLINEDCHITEANGSLLCSVDRLQVVNIYPSRIRTVKSVPETCIPLLAHIATARRQARHVEAQPERKEELRKQKHV